MKFKIRLTVVTEYECDTRFYPDCKGVEECRAEEENLLQSPSYRATVQEHERAMEIKVELIDVPTT